MKEAITERNTIEVVRLPTNHGTFGVLYYLGEHICETLEPLVCDGSRYQGVQDGLYPLILSYSQKFGVILPEFLCLNRSGLRIHAGNYVSQTRGCVLVGRFDVDCLRDSKKALRKVLNIIKKNNIHYIRFSHRYESRTSQKDS